MKKIFFVLVFLSVVSLSYAQTTTKNYIKNTTYTAPHTATTKAAATVEEKIESITYFDDFGRPIQQLGIQQSKSKRDIITYFEYDGYGRSTQEYLPYVPSTAGNEGNYRTNNQKTAIISYYNSRYSEDFQGTTNPYSEKVIEDFIGGKVLEQAAPGSDWAIGSGHTIKFEYATNYSIPLNNPFITDNPSVKLFEINYPNDNYTNPQLTQNGLYVTGELYKTVTKDENHPGTTTKEHTTEEYKNKDGQVVLKRTFVSGSGTLDTYYVYDDYGNLVYVMPPKMEAGGKTQTVANLVSTMNALGYQYKYDNRNRLVEKKIPGKDWESIVYNKLDQPIMTQDANLKAANKWLFTKYDVFGRVIYTGVDENNTSSRTNVQSAADGFTKQFDAKIATAASYVGTTVYYNKQAYPTSFDKVYTINYYDDYDFLASESGITLPSNVFGRPVVNYNNTSKFTTKGLATGSKVRVLTTNDWITTVTGYDEKARPIYVYSKNEYLGTVDIVATDLDFAGRVLKTKTTHIKNGTTIVTIDNFTYDHVGRLLSQTQCIGDQTMGDSCATDAGGAAVNINITAGTVNTAKVAGNSITVTNATLLPGAHLRIDAAASGNAAELIVFNDYDELGQLTKKKVGGAPASTFDNTPGLQTVDYKYNIRGWLKQINNPASLGTDLFAFGINYNTTDHSGTKLYNGNIAETEWKTKNDNTLRWYNYSYDALNRIENAIGNSSNYNLTNVDYDKMGNITKLERRGHTNAAATSFGTMDNLVYSYDTGNKLTQVVDNGNDTYGFKDSAANNQDYWYDANGNMTRDDNKGITSISYNHLNLPTSVALNNSEGNGTISYIYDATGIKQRKVVSTGATTDYAGNYIYENNDLQFFNHAEGYVNAANSNYEYVYQYKDHLGNIRLSYAKNPSNPSIPTIIEENNYYPFGLQHKGYNNVVNGEENNYETFQGQELEEDLGKNVIAYQWRDYDPAIARFNKVDRFAEKYVDVSPYSYITNNPISFREIKGDSILTIFKDKNGKRTNSIPKAVQKMFKEEFGIEVGYNSKTSMLFLKGEVDSELSQSDSATGFLVDALTDTNTGKKADKHGTIEFGYNLSAIKNGSDAVSGGDWTTTGGIYQKGVTQIDLADFDSSGKSNLFTYNSNRVSRSFGLARTFEHEYLGHQRLRSSGFGDGAGYNMGRVVRSTNQFNRERGIPERLNYYSYGYIFFGNTGDYSSRGAQANAVRKMVNNPSSNKLFIKRNSRKN